MDASRTAEETQDFLEKHQGKGKSESKARKSGGKEKGGPKRPKKVGDETASWDLGIDPKKWMGRVVTRFPPEPSGYLHIGHAKAVFLNHEIAREFKGRFLVRLDDTNPVKEKAEFEESILRDLRSLGVEPDSLTHTSDYFGYILECCTRCLREGHAYVDKTPQEELKEQRLHRLENEYRNQSVEENLRLWAEMQKDKSEEGEMCFVRMKLDPKSDNGTLRDPTIYRVNKETAHHRTGKRFVVYPTYDFACPIVDSLEGVTHACRSKEYNERDEQYVRIWNIVCAGRKRPDGRLFELPTVFQFSRLEFVRTVLSKRYLTQLIAQGVVQGWDDPRLPTVQGITRRGLQVDALRAFTKDQGLTTRNNKQEWDKLWTYNKRALDPRVGRYYCVNDERKVLFEIPNLQANSCKTVQLHPKHKERGIKTLHVSNRTWIDQFHGQAIAELVAKAKPEQAVSVALMDVGIVHISLVARDKSGTVTKVVGEWMPKEQNFKKAYKVTWVPDSQDAVPVTLVELDYLFDSEEKLAAHPTWVETRALAEPNLRLLSKGDVIQFMCRGFYILDRPYLGRPDEPALMIFVPDGRTKPMSKVAKAQNKVKVDIR